MCVRACSGRTKYIAVLNAMCKDYRCAVSLPPSLSPSLSPSLLLSRPLSPSALLSPTHLFTHLRCTCSPNGFDQPAEGGALPPHPSSIPAPLLAPQDGDDWLAGLARFLPEVGIEAGLAAETVTRLREAGATEEQLRTSATAEDLKAMGILLGPR